MRAPKMCMGVSPEKAGSGRESLPQRIMASVRKAKDAPTVTMIWARTVALRRGRMASCSKTMPTTMTMRTAPQNAIGRGSPARLSVTAVKPPKHHELALGEVDDIGGVVDEGETQCDERVDAAVRDPAHDVLHELIECQLGSLGAR